jgi:hypothetical protein
MAKLKRLAVLKASDCEWADCPVAAEFLTRTDRQRVLAKPLVTGTFDTNQLQHSILGRGRIKSSGLCRRIRQVPPVGNDSPPIVIDLGNRPARVSIGHAEDTLTHL